MEMSVSIPKDLTANLPAASVLPQLPIAGAGNGKAVNNSSTDNGFSKKLSDAMDKSTKAEPIALKKGQKPQKTSDQDSATETAPTGLAVGLAGNLPPPEVPPTVDSVPNTANSAVPVATDLLEVSGLFAQVVPAIAPGTGNPPLEAGQQGFAEALALLTPVMEKPTVAPQATSLATTATESQTAEPIQTQQSKVSLPEVNMQARTAKEPISPQPNIPTISAEIGSNQDTKPIDARIQQDVVAVQVSSQPSEQAAIPSQISQDALATTAVGTMVIPKTTTANETNPTSELEPVEVDPAIMVGKAEARPEPVATEQTEQEPTERNLGRSEKDTLALDSTDKTETSAVTIASFEKVLSSVNSPSAPDPAVQQSRQDLNEVARQVMDGMTASTDRLKSSQVIITLRPEHLGEVTVKINVDGDRVTAAFHAASSEVRAILESSMPQLRQEMSQNGWKFDSDGVYSGMQQFFGEQHQQRQTEQGQTIISMPQRLKRDEYDDSMAAFTPTGRLQVMSVAAVDYRI